MHISTPDLDSESFLSRYLLPYQVEGVFCDKRYQITRKANRVGWSWVMALKDVRQRILEKKRDCLFTTQNWNGALEYGRYIEEWIALFGRARSIISRTEEYMTVNIPDGTGGTIATQEKVGIFTFDTKSRIILFSSSPWALQTFEGDVRWDECEFHENQERMHTALSTRVQFGYDYHAWSARNGTKTWVNQVLWKLANEPDSGWHVREVDIYKAIEDGLVEKINQKSGMEMTREEFLADCKRRSLTPAIFASRYECKAVDDASAIAPWETLEKAATQPILRRHVMTPEIVEKFGHASDCGTDAAIKARMEKMQAWLRELFAPLFATPSQYRLGYDVAASGAGDLGSFWIAAKVGERLQQRALLTTQTEDWHFHEAALNLFMSELSGVKGAGDGTGIGQAVAWKAEAKFAGRFAAVRFSRASKAEMGTRVMNQLSGGAFEMAAGGQAHPENADIAMDFFTLEKKTEGTGVIFTATQNPLNKASHCDIFWSGALAAHADATVEGSGAAFTVHSLASRAVDAFRNITAGCSPFGGKRPRRLP